MTAPPTKPDIPVRSPVTKESVRPGGPEVPGVRFQSTMPEIPGVVRGDAAGLSQKLPSKYLTAIVVGSLLAVGVIAFLVLRGSGSASSQSATSAAATPSSQEQVPSAAPADLPPAPSTSAARNEIGTLEEFAHPWTAKKFSYSYLVAHDRSPAIAIRLPIGDGRSATSYWAILLKAPYGKCDLEFVPDPKEVERRFGYAATHPMVVDPCSGTVYDPLRTGTLPNGAWARGEIVQGAGFRPPLLVELRVENGHLVATRAEE
jgi:hypothetical protein